MENAIRVLYVDDEPILLEVTKLYIERDRTFAVDTLPSAKEALERLNTVQYDAIVSDYQMPEMDGIGFLKQLKASGNATPFIIFTGRGREEVVIEALNSGADFYIQKGGDPKAQFAELSNKIRYAVTRKRTEEALRESEERYRDMVEDQTEFICRFRPDGTHVFVNDAYCRYFGLKRVEVIGRKFIPQIPAEDRDALRKHFVSLTKTHPIGESRHRIIMPDGQVRWQWWSDRAIFDPDGNISEYQSVGRDISDTIKAEEALHEVNKKLNLLSSITRDDINNQLSVLKKYLAILETKQPDPSLNEYFQKTETAAQRISAMIQFTEEYESIGVKAPVCQDCRTLVETAAKQVPLGTVMVKNDVPAGTEVFADPLVVKVFYNLIDNAVRYGTKLTTIRFSVKESGDDHIIVYEDDGVGVPAEEKEKIFGRAYGKNTGLGLFFSREILSITGITITENGEPGKGARFEISVPKRAYRSGGQP
jgi:PAS domain S-box-containing protein